MDNIPLGDYVDLDDIQVAPEVIKIEEAIRSKRLRLEYIDYIVQCTLMYGI